MAETSFSFSQIESHVAGQTLPQGRHEIRGWVWPKAGEHLVDVRVRCGARHFSAVHGYPRADLARHFQIGRAFALAEFRAVVELAPGAHELVCEALAIDGSWRPFQSLPLNIALASVPADIASPDGALRWHDYGRMLQAVLRAQAPRPEEKLETLIAEWIGSIPVPRDLLHPPPPFRGHVDEPATVAPCRFGRVPLFGYLFHEHTPIQRVFATVDLQVWQTISHTNPSPAPAGYFPQFGHAATCGLAGFVDVPAQLPQPVPLRVYAELPDGGVHLVMALRTRVFTREDEKGTYPDRAKNHFYITHWRLLAALKRAGIAIVEDEAFATEVSRLATEFELRAPTIRPAARPLAAAPFATESPVPRNILLVSHNLDLEGAPLFLVDLARALLTAGAKVTVASPGEGPLRDRLEKMGIAVRVLDAAPIFSATSASEATVRMHALAEAVRGFDVVVANTFTTFWAVHAARAAGVPTLLYVHESTTPTAFYGDRLHPEVITLVEKAFAEATLVSFTTAATRAYHVNYGRPERHRLCPGWVDMEAIDAWRTANSRERLRAEFGLQPGELLVTNVGTVSDRKGQHIFARAVDLLWRRHPEFAARARFVMLGGGASPFDALLGDLLAHLGLPNLGVHPARADYLGYYAAADVFVCSTYEESTPRVVLEAMACETAIVASAVHGIPELVEHEKEALLVPPGDTLALCKALAALLGDPAQCRALARGAAARVKHEHGACVVLPRHVAMVAATVQA